MDEGLLRALSPQTQAVVGVLLVLNKMDADLTQIFEETEERISSIMRGNFFTTEVSDDKN